MKKNFLMNPVLMLLFIAILSNYSCNTRKNFVEEKSGTLVKTDTSGPFIDCDQFRISKKEADEMTNQFNSTFAHYNGNVVTGLNTEFWIDTCTFQAISRTLESKQLDGLRLHSAGNINSTLLLVGTSSVTPSSATYQHTDRWDITMPICTGLTTSVKFNLDETSAKSAKDDFRFNYVDTRKPDEDESVKGTCLSSAIWVKKCVIDSLQKILAMNARSLDGILIYAAAYPKFSPYAAEIGQTEPIQSTFIFVPSRKNGSSHIPVWSLIKDPEEKNGYSSPKRAAFNHSQLCPKICN